METISKSDCSRIGFLRKTHGVHGELVLEFEPEFEESVACATRFFLEVDGLLVPFFIATEGIRFRSAKTAILQFDWVDSEVHARRLVGNSIFLFRDEIMPETMEDTFNQFLNYRLLNEEAEELGVVTHVDDYSGNIVLTLDANDREVLVPFHEELLLEVNEEQGYIKLRLPEGLFD